MGRLIRIIAVVALLASGVLLHRSMDASFAEVLTASRTLIDDHNRLGPLIFVGLCSGAIVLHAPAMLVIAFGGAVFGAGPAFVYGWIATILGMTITFLASRYLLHEVAQASVIHRFKYLRGLDQRIERNGFLTMLLLRLVFVAAPPLNWAIATTRMRFSHYLAGSALGIIPGIAMAAYLADRLTHTDWPQVARSPWTVWLAAGLVAAAALVLVWVRLRRATQAPPG